MRMVSLFTVVTILCCNLINQSQASEDINQLTLDDSAKTIKSVVESYVSNSVFEGTILVSKSGNVIFKEAYGYADRSKNQRTTIDHSFQLASLTKPIGCGSFRSTKIMKRSLIINVMGLLVCTKGAIS